jgi:hypothetical protein
MRCVASKTIYNGREMQSIALIVIGMIRASFLISDSAVVVFKRTYKDVLKQNQQYDCLVC